MSRWTYQAELWAPWYYPYCTDIRLHQTTANLHQQFIKWNLPTFLDHIWSYSVSHLRCNNYNYLIFRWLLLSYTNSFPSPLSSVHTLNILAFLILYLFPFLKFCTFQQSNLCDETLLHHNSHTIHTIFPDFPRPSMSVEMLDRHAHRDKQTVTHLPCSMMSETNVLSMKTIRIATKMWYIVRMWLISRSSLQQLWRTLQAKKQQQPSSQDTWASVH